MRFLRLGALSILGLVAACGGAERVAPLAPEEAAPPPPAPAPAVAPEAPSSTKDEEKARSSAPSSTAEQAPESLASAESDLERARAELDLALGRTEGSPGTAAGAPAASRPADAAEHSAPKKKADAKVSGTSCETACRAFASLERAASAVCRIAGETDARCTRAHDIVASSERRVANCACRRE